MPTHNYTLSELQTHIRAELSSSFPDAYWVIAEIGEMSVNYSGHCYLELIERKEQDQSVTARIRATIWSYQFRMIRPYFETTTNQQLTKGIKILVKATVDYHPLYGLSINIRDIDPTYTLGEQQKKRLEIIERLKSEGVLDMNKLHELPLVPQRIAIISSANAAGYGDFMDQLDNNPFGYKFYTKLFNAVMQGEKTEESVTCALDSIGNYYELFDAVVIIRGGGSQTDLASFDSYWLCFNVAQFPLPVLTGIGHERDDTILDMVAHTKLKTPTAVAEFLIDELNDFENRLISAANQVADQAKNKLEFAQNHLQKISSSLSLNVKEILHDEETELRDKAHDLKSALQNITNRETSKLKLYRNNTLHLTQKSLDTHRSNIAAKLTDLKYNSRQGFTRQLNIISEKKQTLCSKLNDMLKDKKHILELYQIKNNLLNPEKLLEKGYSITTNKEGKIIKSIADIEEGDKIISKLKDGSVESSVGKKINK